MLVGVADKFGIQSSKFKGKVWSSEVTTTIEEHAKFCRTILKMKKGDNLLISNGKVFIVSIVMNSDLLSEGTYCVKVIGQL